MSDSLQKFMFDVAPVRGAVVQLSETWQTIVKQREYPQPVQQLLGEMLAAAALLSANIKFNGALILQLHGDGALALAIVECLPDFSLRATAHLREGMTVDADASLQSLVNTQGKGRFVITLDPLDRLPGQTPYQGIVPLVDAEGQPLLSLNAILQHYMAHSEQLDTRLYLHADTQNAAGLLLQRLPEEGGIVFEVQDQDAWTRVRALAETIQAEELFHLSTETVLRRLFLIEAESLGFRIFPEQAVRFSCTCSRERVGKMLKTLGKDEVDEVLRERESVEIHCDFCGAAYVFDQIDCEQLFAHKTVSLGVAPVHPTTH